MVKAQVKVKWWTSAVKEIWYKVKILVEVDVVMKDDSIDNC